MNPRPREVWLADLGISAKTRPVAVVSRYDEDPPRVLVIYVPLTSEDRGKRVGSADAETPFLRLEGVRTSKVSPRCRKKDWNAALECCLRT